MARNDKLSTYATTVRQSGDALTVTYHKTDIVTANADVVELNTGGWDSVTTRRKMNQSANQFGLGYGVFRQNGCTYVRSDRGPVAELTRRMLIDRRTGAVSAL